MLFPGARNRGRPRKPWFDFDNMVARDAQTEHGGGGKVGKRTLGRR